MEINRYILDLGEKAKRASIELRGASTEKKNAALESVALSLEASKAEIQEENQKDLARGRENELSSALLDRLELNEKRFGAMVQGVRDIIKLDDPVGEVLSSSTRPNGLELSKVRVPIGVIGIVYESRPNVTADASALCFKASNAVILRGGKEALDTNLAIAAAIRKGLEKEGLNPDAVQLVEILDREVVKELVRANDSLDLIIPRGGEGLIEAVTEMATVPVIKHYKGVCHIYVDRKANLEKAAEIIINAKCQRPGVCNALEALLVHKDLKEKFLPGILSRLVEEGVEIRAEQEVKDVFPAATSATPEDWGQEFLDLILAVKLVSDVDDAIAYIAQYGSGHSDSVLSENKQVCEKFLAQVDSAAVYSNASTRFTDGAQFGLGAEIGISTDKLHARGPMGLEELTTYKYVVRGDGQIVN